MSNSEYFPPYLTSSNSNSSEITVDLDLADYPTKTDLNNTTHEDISGFALKTNLSSLKTEVDKLDIPKLTTVLTDLSKLTNKVANDLVEKTKCSELEKKVTDNKTEQDNLDTKVTNNHLTTE